MAKSTSLYFSCFFYALTGMPGNPSSIPSTFPSPSTLQLIYSPGRLGSFPPQGNEPREEVTWQGRGGFRTSPGSSAFHPWIYSWDKLESSLLPESGTSEFRAKCHQGYYLLLAELSSRLRNGNKMNHTLRKCP